MEKIKKKDELEKSFRDSMFYYQKRVSIDAEIPERLLLLDKLTKINFIIYIALTDKTVIKRLTSRRTCRKCGAIYNLISKTPKKEGICDKCGGELYQREDDKEEAVKKRLQVYKNETEPLVNYYKKKGILHEINGEQGIGKIFEDIVRILSK
jgi:adenylate kinase